MAFFSDDTAVLSASGIASSPFAWAVLRFFGCGGAVARFASVAASSPLVPDSTLRLDDSLFVNLDAAVLSDPNAFKAVDGFFCVSMSSSSL